MSKGRRPDANTAGRSADDPAIIDLLDSVREVRTTLAIDLAAAAGALEENQQEVASDILAATASEIRSISNDRPAGGLESVDAVAKRRSRRSRVLLALPAVPLVGALAMTTAAALSGSSSSSSALKPAHHIATSTSAPHSAASTALQRLEDVVAQHPQAAQVIAVADDLHKQLTRMIARSTNNPAQLHVVQQLLQLEQNVLESSKVPGTKLALAASRAIAELLARRPAHSQPQHSFSSHRPPTSAPTMRQTSRNEPTQTHVQPAPQQHQTSPATHASPSPNRTNPLFGSGFFNWP